MNQIKYKSVNIRIRFRKTRAMTNGNDSLLKATNTKRLNIKFNNNQNKSICETRLKWVAVLNHFKLHYFRDEELKTKIKLKQIYYRRLDVKPTNQPHTYARMQ